MTSNPLYKTTIVIWSEYDPTMRVELEDLARDAQRGESYCSKQVSVLVPEPAVDPDWDGTEFFGIDEDPCGFCGARVGSDGFCTNGVDPECAAPCDGTINCPIHGDGPCEEEG